MTNRFPLLILIIAIFGFIFNAQAIGEVRHQTIALELNDVTLDMQTSEEEETKKKKEEEEEEEPDC